MEIKRTKVDIRPEKNLLIALTVSDRVCSEIFPILDFSIFQSKYIEVVARWIKSYFDAYGKAPGKELKDLYEIGKKKLDGIEANLVSEFLSELSQEYEEWSEFNESYLIDRTIEYIDERNLLLLSEKLKEFVNAGRISEAKLAVSKSSRTSISTSRWINPFDMSEVNKAMDLKRDILFRLPGALGDLAGDFERGFFIAFLAPVKRGKTWMLLELSTIALMHKLKVIFVSLEIRKERMQRRIYKRVVSTIGTSGKVLYPCFDCVSNQDNSCDMPERTSNIGLLIADEKPEIKNTPVGYKSCTYCRNKKDLKDNYIPETWWISQNRPGFNIANVRKKINSFAKTYPVNNFRLMCYPRGSANLAQIISDIDMLEYTDNFIPDVIIIDYADILAPENRYEKTRDMVDETWMTLARISDEKKCLVATVSQSNKKSWNAKHITDQDVSEDYRKIAHVDIMFSMSQKPKEKDLNRMRIGVVAHRDEGFNQFRQVTILQNLGAGQPLLDSIDGEIPDD